MNISRKENMKKICRLLYKYRHAWLLSYAFIYLPWFMYLERTVTRDYHIMHASLDDLIPFNEYFIVPYFLWFIYVAGTLIFFLFRSKEDYYKMCAFLFSGMTLSLIICTFFHIIFHKSSIRSHYMFKHRSSVIHFPSAQIKQALSFECQFQSTFFTNGIP